MSIASEITRIQQAKVDIKTAIESKGSEVSGTIDNYANAINNIDTGESTLTGIVEGTVKEIIIPEGTTKIRNYCFIFCYDVTSITIPNSVTSVGEYSFQRCTSLKSMTIPSSVTSVGANAFNTCSAMTTCIWNSTQQYIPRNGFYSCTGLTTLDLSSASQVFRFGTSSTDTTVGLTSHINIHSGLQIIVPKLLYNDWKASSYWANFVDYLYWKDDDGNLQNTTVE